MLYHHWSRERPKRVPPQVSPRGPPAAVQISAFLNARRQMRGHLGLSPAVMMGKPVIHGTRITVELILRKFAGGATEGDLLEDYPHLAPDDIRAARPRLWNAG